MKKRIDIPVGQKVRGYGILNEYGEFEFVPEQTGSRQGRQKIIKTGDNYTLSSTTNSIILHCRVQRGNTLLIIKGLSNIMSNVIRDLREYVI